MLKNPYRLYEKGKRCPIRGAHIIYTFKWTRTTGSRFVTMMAFLMEQQKTYAICISPLKCYIQMSTRQNIKTPKQT